MSSDYSYASVELNSYFMSREARAPLPIEIKYDWDGRATGFGRGREAEIAPVAPTYVEKN